ncbi:MAG: indole-3-glycerol phosphate synthase TrpC [Solirubrobacteraceae bacterium]
MNVLAEIVADTRAALARRRAARPLEVVTQAARERAGAGDRRSLRDALVLGGLSVIAEHKRRSPSAGLIRDGVPLTDVVRAYERAGARALSVLTEESRFGGSLADLEAARGASSLPILRKDFIVDPYQVQEALAGGADAILLIVAALTGSELRSLLALASELGLDTLVEVHDRPQLDAAVDAGAQLVGINNRDLTTLQVDTRRTLQLREHAPADSIVVAESGFSTRAELDELERAGVDGVLVGETLMRSPDIEAACRQLTGLRLA